MSDTQPTRIEPFYQTPAPGHPLTLREEEATLEQGTLRATGKLALRQEWSPLGLFWNLASTNLPDFEFGDVQLFAESFSASGRVLLKGAGRLEGAIHDRVEIGTEHKLDRLTFHLPDYPDFMSRVVYEEEIAPGKSVSWSEIVLVADDWTVRLQPYRDLRQLSQQARAGQQVALTGVGELRKSDGTLFKRHKADSILQAVRVFLSLAFGGWSPPLLQVGSNPVAQRCCERWTSDSPSPRSHLRGWLDLHHGEHLSDAFSGIHESLGPRALAGAAGARHRLVD